MAHATSMPWHSNFSDEPLTSPVSKSFLTVIMSWDFSRFRNTVEKKSQSLHRTLYGSIKSRVKLAELLRKGQNYQYKYANV